MDTWRISAAVYRKDNLFFARVDTQELGVRYKMEGPLRSDEQEVFHDLHYVRSCSEGEATRAEGLHSMRLAAKELREKSKADAQKTELAAKVSAKMVRDEAKTDALATKLAKEAAAQAAKEDPDEAKAATRGVVKADGAFCAHPICQKNNMKQEIGGSLIICMRL